MRPIGTNDGSFSAEFRIKFPGADNDDLPPTQLSGELLTLLTGTAAATQVALWYEKPTATSATGNLYLTSSAGRLTLVSASMFNDDFYNVSIVKERFTGSITLRATRYENGELISSVATSSLSSSDGYPNDSVYAIVVLGSTSGTRSIPEFWGQELRLWDAPITTAELESHAYHFESYGRETSYNNKDLVLHWRLNDGGNTDTSGSVYVVDSTTNNSTGTGSNFAASTNPFTKSLEGYSYIPSIDYGWNQEKVRVYDGASIDAQDRYDDERFVSLEFNMYDALNEDISHLMSSYEELGDFMGLPINRYREDYEGLQQMRETYFKRLQGKLNFRIFADMLDFFDMSFISIVERLMPARALFSGDEMVIESHMLERPKYQYQIRPIVEGIIDISGSIAVSDRDEDFY